MNKNYSIFKIFFLVIILGSCVKEVDFDVSTGELKGSIYDIESDDDFFISYYYLKVENVQVTVEGSKPLIKTITDKEGNYVINGLKSGTYNIIFEKGGYFTYKIIGYQFVGGETPIHLSPIRIYAKPNETIHNFRIEIEETELEPYFKIKAFADTKVITNLPLRLFLSKRTNVSYMDYMTTDIVAAFFPDRLFVDTLTYPVGSQLYLIAYPDRYYYDEQFYTDILTGKKIYTNIFTDNPSNVASVTVRRGKKK